MHHFGLPDLVMAALIYGGSGLAVLCFLGRRAVLKWLVASAALAIVIVIGLRKLDPNVAYAAFMLSPFSAAFLVHWFHLMDKLEGKRD